MRATLWITPDTPTSCRLIEIEVPIVENDLPARVLKCHVFVPVNTLSAFTGLPSEIVIAEFTLFDIKGWIPNAHAHYELSNRPPAGWMWIVHPTLRRFILSRTLH